MEPRTGNNMMVASYGRREQRREWGEDVPRAIPSIRLISAEREGIGDCGQVGGGAGMGTYYVSE